MSTPPIEIHTRYATTVVTLADAWAFVMDHIDKVGPDPSIEIAPIWLMGYDEPRTNEPPRHFAVTVSGSIEEKKLEVVP